MTSGKFNGRLKLKESFFQEKRLTFILFEIYQFKQKNPRTFVFIGERYKKWRLEQQLKVNCYLEREISEFKTHLVK